MLGAEGPAPESSGELTFVPVARFGRAGAGPGEFTDPQGLATDLLGHLYVADTGNDRLQKFRTDGAFVTMVGGFGWGDGQFNDPTDVWAGAGLDVFVVDSQNRRIERYDRDLNFLGRVFEAREGGPDAVGFGIPRGIGVASDGHLYVTDIENHRLVAIDPFDRALRRLVGEFGSLDQPLRWPADVAVARRGELVVADRDAGRLVRFDALGGYLDAVGEGVLRSPSGVAVSRDGRIIVADPALGAVVVFDWVGRVVGRTTVSHPPGERLAAPTAVALGPNGGVYVLDAGAPAVVTYRLEALAQRPLKVSE